MYDPDMVEQTPEEREEEKARYEGLARIALPRFSELQRGEHIARKEILNRLNAIQETGYYVENGYGEMERKQLWGLLERTKTEIRTKASEHCPEVVREIDARNRDAKRSGRDPYLR